VIIDTVCPAVWNHLCVNTNGKNRLCCNSVTRPNDGFLENYQEHWNNYRDGIKKQMIAGIKPDACVSCWNKEELGIESYREHMIFKYKDREEWDSFLNNINVTKQYPTELDLKLGNHCNLSCRMCSSYSSSKYQSEFKKIYSETGIDYGINDHEKNYVQHNWYETDEFYKLFVDIVENGLVELKFTGGEPLIVPNVKKAIDYICSAGKAKDIYLSVITNATKINIEWINKFLQFIHTNIIVSIDGVEDTYEYIRYPTRWNQINDNLTLLSKHKQYKLGCTITFTLQNYNILQAEKMINLHRRLGFDLSAIPLDTPTYLDVRNAPELLKEDALRIIENIIVEDEQEKTFINTFKKKIKQPPLDDYIYLQKHLVDISLLKDPYRNQDFTKTEIYKYYC
jgi:MoaA/NifB/PqqE/SkfB family radical SAM enzyme